MKKKVAGFFSVALILGMANVVHADSPNAQINYASTAPVIDGKVDAAWSDAKVYELKNDVKAKDTTPPASEKDLSVKWRALWDEKNIYFLAEVTDDKKMKGSSGENFDNDGVEFYIDPDNKKANTWGDNDSVLMFEWSIDKLNGWTGTAWAAPKADGASFKLVDTDNGYNVEASIPWTNLLAKDIKAGKLFAMDVMANDNDNGKGRTHKIAWFGKSDNAWQDPSLFATAQLMAAPAKSDTSSKSADSSSKTSDTTSNGTVPAAMPKTGMGGASPTTDGTSQSAVWEMTGAAVIAIAGASVLYVLRRRKTSDDSGR